MVEGRWTGTMCLTEPHCGTDLGLLKTRAEPNAMAVLASPAPRSSSPPASTTSPNIVHLVLAKLPDAPPGAKGISLFIVPKFKVGRDGTHGRAQFAGCGSIEHKMGIHGSATCVMNFDGAEGYLVGARTRACRRCSP
jgi:alkylation response protein AidB-like acyl-CoA dehydrogenase